MQQKHIAIIGAGPAGLGAASALSGMDVKVTLFDKESYVGGHVVQWKAVNPQMTDSQNIIDEIKRDIDFKTTTIELGKEVKNVSPLKHQQLMVEFSNGERIETDAVIYSGGFQLFDAAKKEELGYGVYPRVITSADLEKMLKDDLAFPFEGDQIVQIGIVHCVGSRDTKVNRTYCSKMCCMVGVKQAIELRKRFPKSRVTNFYMDLRMFGSGYEDLYLKAQRDYGVQFIRGRVSEVSENMDGSLQVKAEDTLMAKPIRGRFDLLVLMVGMEGQANPINAEIDVEGGFVRFGEEINRMHSTSTPGVFVAGSCKGPASIAESFNDGKSAGLAAIKYFKNNSAN